MEKIDLKPFKKSDFDKSYFDPKRLALVHVTNHMPKREGDHWEIQSTAEATDYIESRNTIHFTVGHEVESHAFGSWVKTGIMIVTPLMGVIDENDKPLGMCSTDTYFETTPGHNLKLPKGTEIFVATENPSDLQGELIKKEGDVTYYKASHFTPKEKEKIFNRITHPYFDGDGEYSYYYGFRPYHYSDREEFSYCPAEWSGNIEDSMDFRPLTLEDLGKLPDHFFSDQMKQILLSNWIEENGYLSNTNFKFSQGSDEVMELGKKLGCRFYGCSYDFHHCNCFEWDAGRNAIRYLKSLDFVFHPEKYRITSKNEKGEYIFSAGTKETTFYMKPDELGSYADGKEIMSALRFVKSKERIDLFEARYREIGERANSSKTLGLLSETDYYAWSDAFKATYAMWLKKNVARLHKYHKLAKDFNLETWKKQLCKQMDEFDHPKQVLEDFFTKYGESCEGEKKSSTFRTELGGKNVKPKAPDHPCDNGGRS